jgi:hypothetical protein
VAPVAAGDAVAEGLVDRVAATVGAAMWDRVGDGVGKMVGDADGAADQLGVTEVVGEGDGRAAGPPPEQATRAAPVSAAHHRNGLGTALARQGSRTTGTVALCASVA